MAQVDDEVLRLEAALAAQENLRATLGDAVVDVTVSALRARLEALRAQRPSPLPAPEPKRGHELSPAFVGREAELKALLDAARALEEGQGHIITLAGEVGIGKSRLLAEYRHQLGERVRWLEGRCSAHTTSVSFGPFLDMLRRKAGITGDHSEPAARSMLHAILEHVFPGDAEAHAIFAHLLALRASRQQEEVLATLPALSLRHKLFELVERYYFRLAQRRPTVLVLEDLHWADPSSIELLAHLFAVTRSTRLLVICTFRPQREGPPVELLAHLAARHPERHLPRELAPLSESHSARMLEQLLSLRELPEALRTFVSRRAEGNPFFVEELLRSYIERGALVRDEAGWRVTPLLHTLQVPDTLQDVLMARLDRLPAEAMWLAQQASVIGRSFLCRVLMHMARHTATVEADLRHLEREGIIREHTRSPELEYVFKHALTQDVAYQSLLASRRKELHRKVGEALETLFSDRVAEFQSVIGDHYLRGEEWERAVTYLVAAGESAARLYAHAEARVHFTKALEALAQLPATEANRRLRVDTGLQLVSVSYLAEKPERNFQRMVETESLALGLSAPRGGLDQERLARVHYWMGRLLVYRGAYGEAMSYFHRVLEEGRHTGDPALLAIPSFMVGRVQMLQGHFGQARRLLAQAITPLEQAGDQVNWLYTVGFHALTLATAGHYREGLAEQARAVAVARETNNVTGISFCHLCLAHIRMHGADMPGVLEACRIALTTAERAGEPIYTFLALGWKAWAESRLGQHEEAAASAASRKSLMERLGQRLLATDWFAASDAEMALRAGRPQEALALARQTAAEAHTAGGIFAEGLAERVLGQALAARGDWREAEAHLHSSVRCFETGEALLEAAHTHVLWAELLGARGEGEAARAHLTQALVTYERSGLERERTRARRLLDSLPASRSP